MVLICQQKTELLAYNKYIKNGEYINAKSLKFLSLEGLYKALIRREKKFNYPQFSDHYFTGDYPIKPSDNLQGLKVNNYLY